MYNSIFDRIYSYRERNNKDSKENFLIEIFSFCLETDKRFFNSFLSLLKLQPEKEYSVKTQAVYEQGRPDVEIGLNKQDVSILVECKIDHFERPNQLIDYRNILLKKNAKKKYLIYLTKYYDLKNFETKGVLYKNIKWSNIYDLIQDDYHQITIQLKQYINEQNMSDSNNFQYQDLSALKTITSTITKMDEVLDSIKPYFEGTIGRFSKDSARSTRLSEERYVNYHQIRTDSGVVKYSIEAGFYWWDDDIHIALRIYIPTIEKNSNSSKINSLFRTNLKNWELEEWDEAINFWYYKPIASFIANEEDQIPAMTNYLIKGIDELASVRRRYFATLNSIGH